MPLAETFFFVISIPAGKVEVLPNLLAKKEIVGDNQCLFHDFAVGESIDIDSIVLVVEAIEKTSVQERNGPIG